MGKRVTQPIAVGGGLFKSGDPVKAPANTATKLKNLFVRPGPRIEKRAGWANDAITPVGAVTTAGFLKFLDASNNEVLMAATNGPSDNTKKRASDGTWSDIGTDSDPTLNYFDYTNLAGTVYVTWKATDVLDNGDSVVAVNEGFKYDGTTVTKPPFGNTLASGRTIESFLRRLFIGNAKIGATCEMDEFNAVYDTAGAAGAGYATWTAGGAGLTLTPGATATLASAAAATGTLSLTTTYTTAAETYVNWTFTAQNTDAVNDAPFTLSVMNAAATSTYAKRDILVQNRTTNAEWQTFWVTAKVPSGVNVLLRITAGNTSKAATATTLNVSTSNGVHGTQLTLGRFIPSFADLGSFASSVGSSAVNIYRDAFYWCETDDTSTWLATGYYRCREEPGDINVIRNVGGRLCVFKNNAVWAFQPSADPDLPVQFEKLHRGFGCKNPRSIRTLEGIAYFISDQEIYAWDGSGEPQPLAGEAMRETLFSSSILRDYDTILAIDSDKKEVWVYTLAGNAYVYNIENKTWTGPITITGASDSALNIRSLLYIKPSGESTREMWALLKDSLGICKLRSSQTQDTVSGTQNVTAEVWLHPLETQRPRHPITLESAAIDHQISAQGGSDQLTFEVSTNGGSTFPKSNQVVISDLSAGAGDTKRLTVPLWQTAKRLLVGIKHVGLAGAAYFNMTGGDFHLQVRGEEIPDTKPTQGSHTL